jgi:hypothetical protein
MQKHIWFGLFAAGVAVRASASPRTGSSPVRPLRVGWRCLGCGKRIETFFGGHHSYLFAFPV